MESNNRIALIEDEARRLSAGVLRDPALRGAYRDYAIELRKELIDLTQDSAELRARTADAVLELTYVELEGAPLSLRLARRKRALEASRAMS